MNKKICQLQLILSRIFMVFRRKKRNCLL